MRLFNLAKSNSHEKKEKEKALSDFSQTLTFLTAVSGWRGELTGWCDNQKHVFYLKNNILSPQLNALEDVAVNSTSGYSLHFNGVTPSTKPKCICHREWPPAAVHSCTTSRCRPIITSKCLDLQTNVQFNDTQSEYGIVVLFIFICKTFPSMHPHELNRRPLLSLREPLWAQRQRGMQANEKASGWGISNRKVTPQVQYGRRL